MFVNRHPLVLSAVATLLVSACSGFPRNEPGAGLGQITISSPRVEGRERLINERREQEQWLRRRLDALDTAEFGVSGEVELRSLAVTAFQAGINLDPNLRLDSINRERQALQLRQAADDERALGAFRANARDQVLADRQAGKITVAEGSEQLKALGYDTSVPKPSMAASAANGAATGGASKPGSEVSAKTDANKVTPPSDAARRSGVGSSPIEAFQDRLAAREVIRNELNDVRLDDLHDLSGHTLYRLTLNAEVLPQDDASAWAVARLRITLPKQSPEELGILLARAKEQFERRMVESALATQRELVSRLNTLCWKQEASSGLLGVTWNNAEHQRAFRRAMLCATSDLGRRTRASIERLVVESELPAVNRAPGNNEPAWERDDLPSLRLQELLMMRQQPSESDAEYDKRRLILARWGVWLGQLMARYREELWNASALACIETQKNPPASCLGVVGNTPQARFEYLLNKTLSASVYSVTPKETVQQLSEVASNRKVTEFLMSLNAVTSTAGIAAGLQNTRAYDAFYSALRRQPLIVGMTESGRVCPQENCPKELVFGWVLGPSFQLSNDGKSTRYRHTVVQRSVSAELVLPAWLDYITIVPETYWVRETGETVPSASCRQVDSTACAAKPIIVQLPARPLEALEAVNVRNLREPRVDKYQYLDVVAGKKASVLITGQNVWRSTDVLIGPQRANLLTVLPDNSGVVASFDEIQAVNGADTPKPNQVYLTLFTAEGRVEAGRVQVHASKEEAVAADTKPLTFSGSVPRVVAGAEHSFELSAPLKASESAVVRIGSKKDVNLRVMLDKTTQLNDARNKIAFALPAASVPNLKKGDSILVDLLITRPSGGVEVVSVVKAGTYYEKDADLDASATLTRAKLDQPIKVTLNLPPGSVDGFASLARGAARVAVTLKFEGAEEPEVLESDCPIDVKRPTNCEAVLDAKGVLKATLSKLKNADMRALVALKGDDNPRLKAEEMAIKP